MEIEAASSNNSNINLLWTANEELEDSKGDFTMIYQQLARKMFKKFFLSNL